MRSAFRGTLVAIAVGLLASCTPLAVADTPVATAIYRPSEQTAAITPVRAYRYGAYYRPYVRGYYRPYTAYRPYYGYRNYGYRAYGGYPYRAYRPYPYSAYRPYYGRYGASPYYGGYYTYGRPAFTFGFGW